MCENSTSATQAKVGGLLGVVLMATALGACKSEDQRARKLEAQRMSDVIRAVREAPHNAKSQSLRALETIACHYPSACLTQQICIQAYGLHQRAVERSSALRQRLRDSDPGTADDDAMGQLLIVTEKDIERAKQMMDECLRLETAMLIETR